MYGLDVKKVFSAEAIFISVEGNLDVPRRASRGLPATMNEEITSSYSERISDVTASNVPVIDNIIAESVHMDLKVVGHPAVFDFIGHATDKKIRRHEMKLLEIMYFPDYLFSGKDPGD